MNECSKKRDFVVRVDSQVEAHEFVEALVRVTEHAAEITTIIRALVALHDPILVPQQLAQHLESYYTAATTWCS